MKKTYIIFLTVLFTTFSFAQKINADKTGFAEEIVFEGDKTKAYNSLKNWAEKRYKSKESKLKIEEDVINSKGHIPMAFLVRQGKIDMDINYKFYYDIILNLNGDKIKLELLPSEIDVQMPNSGYVRMDNSMYQYLIVDEKVDVSKFKEITIIGIENANIPKKFMKNSKKLLEKHVDTYYEDYLVNLDNYKAEVKAVFDSARKAVGGK